MSHFVRKQQYGRSNGNQGYDKSYYQVNDYGSQRYYYKNRGYRVDGGRGSSPYKYRNYSENADYDQKDEQFTNDPRVFFAQKPSEDTEKDINSMIQYYQNKYRKLFDREQLKRGIEEDIYKVNPQLEHYDMNRLIKIRLVFDEKQSDKVYTQKSEDLFQFDEADLKRFFHVFGKIEKIVIKDKCVSYIFFQDLISAFCAQRAMNNFILEDINARLEIQLCVEDPDEQNENKLIGHFMHETIKDEVYLIRISTSEDDKQMKQLVSKYKYTSMFTMEINDPEFHLKERIMGASASNFFRLFYLCEKNSVETGNTKQNSQTGGSEDLVISLNQAKEIRNQQQNNSSSSKSTNGNNSNIGSSTNLSTNQSNSANTSKTTITNSSNLNNNNNPNSSNNQNSGVNFNNSSGNNNNNSSYSTSEEITFRMIVNDMKQTQNEVLILSNNLEKYNTATRYMHELLAQVNEEYRHFCEFQKKINPGPLHIKRIEKFNLDPELTFISTKDLLNKSLAGKENNIQKGEGSDKISIGSTSLQFVSNSNNINNSNNNNQSMQIEYSSFSSQSGVGSSQDFQQKLLS
ncbi:hypothetical protein ABPG74_018793 [Tetrahymena malaccensis]